MKKLTDKRHWIHALIVVLAMSAAVLITGCASDGDEPAPSSPSQSGHHH